MPVERCLNETAIAFPSFSSSVGSSLSSSSSSSSYHSCAGASCGLPASTLYLPLLPPSMHFLGLLNQGTARAPHDGAQVPEPAALDPVSRPDLGPDHQPADDAEDRHGKGQTAQGARVSDGLGVSPEGVAGQEEGEDAQAAVVEAAKQAAVELPGHVVVRRDLAARRRLDGDDVVRHFWGLLGKLFSSASCLL